MAKIVQCMAFNQLKLSFIISHNFENKTMLKIAPLGQFVQSLIKTQSSLNSRQAQQKLVQDSQSKSYPL